jgi:hypothetical protein
MTEPFRFWADAQQHVARIPSLSERVEARNRFIRDHFESDVAQVAGEDYRQEPRYLQTWTDL